MRLTPAVVVDADDAAVLESWIRDGPPARALRARIVLLSRDGLGATAVSDLLGCSRQTVVSWRGRYRAAGLSGLADAPRSGRPATVDTHAVVARTLQPPPEGAARWSTRLVAAQLGISNAAVAKVWRARGLVPGADGTLWLAAEPYLDAAVDRVEGLHAGPSLRLLVLRAGVPGVVGRVARWTTLGARLAAIDTGPGGEPSALTAFLEGLGGCGTARRALCSGTVPPAVLGWARAQDVTLHTAPCAASWSRLAHLACVRAAAPRTGAPSVAALSEFLGAGPRHPLSWVAEGDAPPPPRTG
ncbi:helix-turn-helix domain-containing protein [Pseudonocardia sichuanensis]